MINPGIFRRYRRDNKFLDAHFTVLVDALVQKREIHRDKKEFKEADQVRILLKRAGVSVEDNRDGSTWWTVDYWNEDQVITKILEENDFRIRLQWYREDHQQTQNSGH